MAFCTNCMAQILDNTRACPNCGAAQQQKQKSFRRNNKMYRKTRKIMATMLILAMALSLFAALPTTVGASGG